MRSIIIAGLLAALTGACSESNELRGFCTSDEDCLPGYRCDRNTGMCVCASDEVCAPDEYCAPDGICRRRMSCDCNLDCPDELYCDTTTGNCIELYKCTKDEQCSLGEICSESYFRCVEGCHQHGDCVLGQVCQEGQCVEGICGDKTFCDYGQICESVEQKCVDDDRGPYCSACGSGSASDPHRCGPGANFCLLTKNDPNLEPFCGVDCSGGQECPHGYTCNLILIAPGDECRQDDECPSETCHINEGDEVGFCLCASDDECPQDSCNEFTMSCLYTLKPCTPGGNECERPIFCIDGLCLLGYNCAPMEGLECVDLK
jgi:hypothetical protein